MPIPVMNYAALPTQGNPLYEGLLDSIQQGLQLGASPKVMQQNMQYQKLVNALKQNELNFAPQMSQQKLQGLQLGNQNQQIQNQYLPKIDDAQLAQMAASTGLTNERAKYLPQSEQLANALKQLQIQSLMQKNNDPLGGKFLPGDAGQYQALETIKAKFGEDSQLYKDIKKSIDSKNDLGSAQKAYYSERGLSPEGKLFVEKTNVAAGLSPNGIPLKNPSDMTPEEIKNVYGNLLTKKSVPAQVLQKNLYAANIEKTLNSIDENALTSQSGLVGGVNRLAENIASGLGAESSSYDKYRIAASQAQLLGHQVRQFYGDSIQPEVLRQINFLSNPTNWRTSPELARKMFDSFKSILRSEMSTLRQAAQSPNVYTGQSDNSPQQTPSSSQSSNPDPLGLR